MSGSGEPGSATRPAGGPDAPRRRRTWTVILAAVIVVLAAVAVYLFLGAPGPETHVRAILLDSPDDACGLADEMLALHGYNSSGTAATTVAFRLPNLNGSSCTIESIGTSTPGFSVGGVALPISIAARGSVGVSVSLGPPASSYTGNVTLVLR
jgi:hypothetical protein